jgi:hypothetical protein
MEAQEGIGMTTAAFFNFLELLCGGWCCWRGVQK